MKIKMEQVPKERGVPGLGREVKILVEVERSNLDTNPAIPIKDRSSQNTMPGELVGPIALLPRSKLRQLLQPDSAGNELLDPESEPGEMLLEKNQKTHFVPDAMAEDAGKPEHPELGRPVSRYSSLTQLSRKSQDSFEDLMTGIPAELKVVAVFFPGLIIEPIEPGIEHIQKVLERDLSSAMDTLLQGHLLMVTTGQGRIDAVETKKVEDECHRIIIELEGPNISSGEGIFFIGAKPQALLVKFAVVAVGMQVFADFLREENGKKDIILRCVCAKVFS
jgi:hypothetical protein